MGLISRLRERCYCAFCKTERRIYRKKHISLTNVVAASFLSVTLMQAVWGRFEPRGLVLFCLFLLVAEVFIYMRWRASVVCKMCGFDPVVYKRSPEAAAQRVRAFFLENAEDPKFQLTRSPLLEVQRKRLERERKERELRYIEAKMKAKRSSSLTPTKSV